MCLIAILTIVLCSIALSGQTFVTNKAPIDKDRYDGITGSPYYFDEHIPADVYLKNDTKAYPVVMNINLQEDEIEVFEKDQYAELDLKTINYISFGSSGKIFLLDGKMKIQWFKNDTYQVLDDPRISIRESTHRPPGEVIIKKKFSIKNAYQLLTNDLSYDIELKKKSISKVLGKDAEKAAKKNGNKLKNMEDLIELLTLLSKS